MHIPHIHTHDRVEPTDFWSLKIIIRPSPNFQLDSRCNKNILSNMLTRLPKQTILTSIRRLLNGPRDFGSLTSKGWDGLTAQQMEQLSATNIYFNSDTPRNDPSTDCSFREKTDEVLDRILGHQISLPHSVSLSSLDIQPMPLPHSGLEMAFGDLPDENVEEISLMNRNARRPKRANKGARPCSRSSRRWKKDQIGKRRR